jgi:hypothetical protein
VGHLGPPASGSVFPMWIRIQPAKMTHKSEENSSFEVLDVFC